MANCYNHNYRPSRTVLKKHGILKKLKNNNGIVILKPDKGNGVVILNKTDYTNSIINIISDTSKFKVLNKDPTLTRERQLKNFLCALNKKGCFDSSTYDKIHPRGSSPARIHGLPKIHKKFFSSPISSSSFIHRYV